MSATTWLIIGIVGFALSGILLVAAILLFIKMNIPAVIGNLTGKTVAREIKAMRDANAPSSVSVNHDRVAEKLSGEEIYSPIRAATHASNQTSEPLPVDENRETDVLLETALLPETRQTEVLSQFHPAEGSVDNVSIPEVPSETTVLRGTVGLAQENVEPVTFNVTRSVIKINTDEVI